MDNMKKELATLAQDVFEKSGLTKKEFCEKLGLSSSNWGRDIESGTWLSSIENLLAFHKAISSDAVSDFILSHFEIKLQGVATIKNSTTDTLDELKRLKKQNETYRKKLREVASKAAANALDQQQEATAILTILLDA